MLLTSRPESNWRRNAYTKKPGRKTRLNRCWNIAEKLRTEPLPVFDKQWWDEASKRRRQDIYPEIHQHTGHGVARPMASTPSAAIAYAISGDPRYAEAVRRILLHYADYEFVAKHPDVGMNWSGWLYGRLAGLRPGLLKGSRRQIGAFIDDFFGEHGRHSRQRQKIGSREGRAASSG